MGRVTHCVQTCSACQGRGQRVVCQRESCLGAGRLLYWLQVGELACP